MQFTFLSYCVKPNCQLRLMGGKWSSHQNTMKVRAFSLESFSWQEHDSPFFTVFGPLRNFVCDKNLTFCELLWSCFNDWTKRNALIQTVTLWTVPKCVKTDAFLKDKPAWKIVEMIVTFANGNSLPALTVRINTFNTD